MVANNPSHGDPIVKAVEDQFGSKKLVATDQFQAFLDELGILFDTLTSTTSGDALQILMQNDADTLSSINNLQAKIKPLSDSFQLIEDIAAQIGQIKAESSRMNKTILELEQLAHVN